MYLNWLVCLCKMMPWQFSFISIFSAVCNLCKKQQAEMLMELNCVLGFSPPSINSTYIRLPATPDIKHSQWHMNSVFVWDSGKKERPFGIDLHDWCCDTNTVCMQAHIGNRNRKIVALHQQQARRPTAPHNQKDNVVWKWRRSKRRGVDKRTSVVIKAGHKHRGGRTVNICLALHSFPRLSYYIYVTNLMSFSPHLSLHLCVALSAFLGHYLHFFPLS